MIKNSLFKTTVIISLFMLTIPLSQFLNNNPLNLNAESASEINNSMKINAYSKSETLKLKIELIGFNDLLIDEDYIENELYDYFKFSYVIPQSEFHFSFEFNYMPEIETQGLEDYICSIAVNGTGTGYRIDTELLQEDLISGDRSNIFIPIDGMSIDADLVNEYIYQNLYEEPINEPGYTFYITNFSNFDTPDHSLEHWYDTHNIGLDSNETITWWYSGYGNLEKRAAMGWGGKYRFCYLDLSARSWYLDFVRIAWYNMGIGNRLYNQYPDVDNLTQTFDPYTTEGQLKLNTYLIDWINTYLANLFSGPVNYTLPIGNSVSLQVKVFNNLTANGYPEETLKWCISQNRIYYYLARDFPWIEWQIDIEWVELSDYKDLFNYTRDNIQEDVNGQYIEVSQGLFSVLENQLDAHFNLTQADIVLPCYFFLTNNVYFKWQGISFAGLGGMGWEILLGTQNSLFENGIITEPRRGMSSVMIHELGHSLGLPHPHNNNGWGSSYIADAMSYFSTVNNFSTFYKDGIGRAHSDANYFYALMEFTQAMQFYEDAGKPATVDDLIIQINNTIKSIPNYYKQMDYNNSTSRGIEARALISNLIDYLQNPSTDTTTDEPGYSYLGLLFVLPILYLVVKKRLKRN